MTAPLETLRQATLTWVAAYAKPDGTALTTVGLSDAVQVIFADQADERPDLPYLTIGFTSPGAQQGYDETRVTLTGGGAPQIKAHGRRTAVLSIQGYGEDTAEWLEELRLSCAMADQVADTLEDAGYPRFGFHPEAPVQKLDQLLDTSFEPRYGFDVAVHYTVSTGTAREQIEAETIEADVTTTSDACPDLSTSITIDV